MNNAFLKTRFRIFSALGLIPGTASIEKREKAIEKEYNYLLDIQRSDELARYEELKNYLQSDEFKEKKREINDRKYKNSEPYNKEKRFKKLKNSDPVKTYLKVAESKELDHYLKMKDSDSLKRFYELKEFFDSNQFEEFKRSLKQKRKQKKSRYKELKKDPELKNIHKRQHSGKQKREDPDETEGYNESVNTAKLEEFQRLPEEIDSLKFENTKEYGEYKEYKQLKKNPDIKKALRFRNSKKLAIYQAAVESETLKEYQDLKDYIESDDFLETKKYLKTKDKFKLSDEYKLLQEYQSLKKSDGIRWYYKHVNSKKFAFYRKYEQSFLDDFDGNDIDGNRWLTSYYWGKALLNESYVQASDAHFFTEGNNIKVNDSILSIITRQEEVEGKVWHPNFGFYPRNFSYTSGIINTGQSFRQKYGLFRAKVRLSHARHLRHCFWMVPEKILPELDVFNYSGESPRKMEFGSYTGDPKDKDNLKVKRSHVKGPNFSKRYYIFTLDWKPDQLIWKINGITVSKFKSNIPDEPMYMILNSGLDEEIDNSKLPREMHVDWVEAFKER